MSSWIYAFSRFSHEVLLLEALGIFSLIAIYAGFWVMRKRRFGSFEQTIPVALAKQYLNQLIKDASQLRTQLFGLLAEADAANLAGVGLGIPAVIRTDPTLDKKLTNLEEKLRSQGQAMEALMTEKQRLEGEVTKAQEVAQGASEVTGSDSPALDELKEKLKQLEAKLAEYNVIEDDLANLKRLQQENAMLRTKLQGQGVSPEVAAPAAITVAVAASTEPEIAASASPPAPPPEEPEVVAPKTVVQAPAAPEPTLATSNKSDEDLLSEFEKMLNS